MQGLFSSPRSGSVQTLSLMFVAAALSIGNFLLDMSIETARGQLIPIAGGGDVLNAQINPDFKLRGNRLGGLDRNGRAQPPVPDRILSKAAAFPLNIIQTLMLKDPQSFA